MTVTVYARSWIFSFIEYDETELESLRETLSKETKYAIFKRGVDSKKTSYIKGYASFRDGHSLESIKRLLGSKVHVRMAHHTTFETYYYCSREGNFEEFGERSEALKFNDFNLLNADSDAKSTKTPWDTKTKKVPKKSKESPKRKRKEAIDEKSTKPFHEKRYTVFVFSLDS